MEKCVDSLLPGGDEVEILIVNDGSSDRTAEIADRYEKAHPGIVRALHKPNGGHGDAVNRGLREARGLYFKVVDSDDWVDAEAYRKTLEFLRGYVKDPLDLLIVNYVFEKQGAARKMAMRYGTACPQHKVFSWKDLMVVRPGQLIHMHAAIYRTGLLRSCNLRLPKHMFYVDNIFVYQPLPHVKRMYYLNVDFYRYFIGRSDQSVNEKILIKRQDQPIAIVGIMSALYDLSKIREPKLRRYMLKFLEMDYVIPSIVLMLDGTPEALKKRDKLWADLKRTNPYAYKILRRRLLGICVKFKSRPMQKLTIASYRVLNKMYGFN